jgi:hypothetical protein
MDQTSTDTPPHASEPPAAAPRRDAEGLPLDREPTIDDVRGGENHFKLAVGCSAVVVMLILAFWVLRVLLAS